MASDPKALEMKARAASFEPGGVTALSYHCGFGDGRAQRFLLLYPSSRFTVRPTVDGPDDVPYAQRFSIRVSGELKPTPQLRAPSF
jgi:hypothetical protein